MTRKEKEELEKLILLNDSDIKWYHVVGIIILIVVATLLGIYI